MKSSTRKRPRPFDLADELHLKFDAVPINRRAMQQQGRDYCHYLDIATLAPPMTGDGGSTVRSHRRLHWLWMW